MSESGNLLELVNRISRLYEYKRIGTVNDHMLSVVQVENRTLDFHVHESSDELFYVIEGMMQVEFDDRIVTLNTGDFLIVPQGTRHRPVCTTLVKCLLIEKDGTLTKENSGPLYEP